MKIRTAMIILLAALAVAACSNTSTAVSSPSTAAEPAVAAATATVMDSSSDVIESTDMPAESSAAADTVSFSQDVWPIIEQYALAAHGGKGGVFLESYNDIMDYVVPGDPENSMLYKSLIGDGMQRMPPDAPLPDEMIRTIYDWIAQGALNN